MPPSALLRRALKLRPARPLGARAPIRRGISALAKRVAGGGGVRRAAPPPTIKLGPRSRITAAQSMIRNWRRVKGGVHKRLSEAEINHRNRLAGPSAVLQTGPPLSKTALEFPVEIKAGFAISIRPLRAQGFRARVGPWSSRIQIFAGTNGQSINIANWQTAGKLNLGCSLRRGELGCYDSHVRIWETIKHQKIPLTLIAEDDTQLRYIPQHQQLLRNVLDELKTKKIEWDLLYIGGRGVNSKTLGKYIGTPTGCQGLHLYLLTLKGAEFLLSKCVPYRLPVDVLVANLSDSGQLKAVASIPHTSVVAVHSDTAHIK